MSVMMPGVRNPRAEAVALSGEPGARVLEPSPPAVPDPPWKADDPTEGGTLLPVEREGAVTWEQLCLRRGDTALVGFCLQRWLGPWRRLEPLPADATRTRESLRLVAAHIVAPARAAHSGCATLRWTMAGFGTPFFAGDRQVRVERDTLFDGDRGEPLTTLAAAARLVAAGAGVPAPELPPAVAAAAEERLAVDPDVAAAYADFFGFCTSVLEQLRAESLPGDEPGRVELRAGPMAVEVELGARGARATFGGAAGEGPRSLPYLYVCVPDARLGPFWNEPDGASLAYRDLLGATSQRATALEFFRTARALLDQR